MQPLWWTNLTADDERVLRAEMPLLPQPDLLVVGGGLVGLAAGYFAAERGLKVQVVEAGALAGGASGGSAGGVCPNLDALRYPAGYRELALLGRDLWGRLGLRPGFSFDWKVGGLLKIVAADEAERTARDSLEAGFSVRAIDGAQAALLEPALRSGVPAGLHYPSEAQLHPVKAAAGFARGIVRRGGSVRTGTAVTGLTTDGGRVTAVETTAGNVSPGQLLVATGARRPEWLPWPTESPWPIRPVAGQLIATDPLPPLLKAPVVGTWLVFQAKSGAVVTGSDEVETESDVPDPRQAEEFARAAAELVPALAGAAWPHAWRRVRPATADGLPVVDRVPGLANVWLSCGHFRKGVLLAPACGKLWSDWLCDEAAPAELACCAWRRLTASS